MLIDPAMAGRRSGELVTDPSWRVRARALQEEALPSGRVVVSCSAPFGVGGLGRHLEEIVAALDRGHVSNVCICESTLASDPAPAYRRISGHTASALLAPLTRPSPAWRMWKVSTAFDREAARRLPPGDHLIGFNGTSATQFRAAGRANYKSISLVSATAHARRLVRQHARAHRQYPVERSWATRVLERNLREYAQAQRIYVSSRYTWESFVEEGVSADLLSLFPLTPHPRFVPDHSSGKSSTFDIVYVGALTVDKGVPLLIDAVRRVPYTDLRLVLVGGWKTRAMRRLVEGAIARDSRIAVSAIDPLACLRSSRLYVHPAYSDGFSYSAAEALACGVPVIVSEDTGMKDLISTDRDGLVLPTGDLDALTEAIEAAYRGEILGG
jgi:glycosyltransferase involved in cell wall biosynthesis